MRQRLGWWGVSLGFSLWAGTLYAAPPIPDSVKVTVLVTTGNAFAVRQVTEVPGTLYTRIDPRERERIGGPAPRFHPLITFGKDQVWDWKWRDAVPLTDALERLSHKDGTLIFEMEDGTWATGSAMGLKARDGIQEGLFLAVTVWDLRPGEGDRLESKSRVMNIPLEDVADRVFRTPVLTETLARETGAEYFLTSYDEALLPITVLGIERSFAWVCATKDLQTADAISVDKFLVPLELLRRIPQGAAAKPFYRRAARNPLSKKSLAKFARSGIPACLADLAGQGSLAVVPVSK